MTILKPWQEQLKERFLWYSDTTGKQYLWDDLGQQIVDEVIMEEFIQTVVVPQAKKEGYDQAMSELYNEEMRKEHLT